MTSGISTQELNEMKEFVKTEFNKACSTFAAKVSNIDIGSDLDIFEQEIREQLENLKDYKKELEQVQEEISAQERISTMNSLRTRMINHHNPVAVARVLSGCCVHNRAN